MRQLGNVFQFREQPKVSFEMEFRRATEACRVLDAVFLFEGRPVRCACSECHKLFSLRMDEMFSARATVQYVETDFRQHS